MAATSQHAEQSSPNDPPQPTRRPRRGFAGRPEAEQSRRVALGSSAIGGLLAAAAVAFFVYSASEALRGIDLGVDDVEARLAPPGVLLLLATCAFWVGETFRRTGAVGQRPGGGKAYMFHATPLRFHVLWTILALTVWAVLVPLPFILESTSTDAVAAFAEASDNFWILLAVYGFTAAGIAGVLAGSLLKKWGYAVLGTAEQLERQTLESRRFWYLVSAKARTEGYFAFIGAGTAGMLPILFRDTSDGVDTIALLIVLSIAAVCCALAVVISLNAWRSSIPMAYVESLE